MDKITVTFNNETIVVQTDEEDLIQLELPKNYARVNIDKITELSTLLSRSQLGNLFKLVPLTKTENNMLYNGNIPHTMKTLQKYLGFSNRSRFGELMSKWDDLNIIKKVKNKKGRINFILNPLFSTRRKTYHPILEEYFIGFIRETDRISYKNYISSKKWKEIRLRIIEDRGGKCERCISTESLQVHHLTYENFGNELDTDLEVLCKPCHMKEHGRNF